MSTGKPLLCLAFVLLAVPWRVGSQAETSSTATGTPAGLRRPVAMALAGDGKWLFVANQGCGSITAIETAAGRVAAEVKIGRGLSDLVTISDGQHLLAVNAPASELLLLTLRPPTVAVAQRIKVSPGPVSVRVSPDGSRGYVLSLWPRQLTIVELPPTPRWGDVPARIIKVVTLPFAPRMQVLASGDRKLIVMDAFGGRLAVVDVRRGNVESVRELPAHNIRGLALSSDGARLLVAHQNLNPLGHTTRDDIHWGNVVTNQLRLLSMTAVLKADADLLQGSRLVELGEAGRGASDPAGIAFGSGGRIAVALAGNGELAFGPESGLSWERVTVGRRPTAVHSSPDGRRLYVANTVADSVSVVDCENKRVTAEIPLGAVPKLSPAERGELLFYDARLSHDGWFSCHSCHTDGHTNGRRNDNLGDNSFGAPKRVMSLLGVKDTAPYAWNGGMPDLEDQVRKSMLTTMHGPKPSDEQVRDLAAYLRTLAPPPPLAPVTEQAERGRRVFEKQSCAACHGPPMYTSRRTYDVGLTDEVGNTLFNPPSLRGVGQGGPYFHDNRAATLEEVFRRFKHQLKSDLTPGELGDLVTFLRSL